MTLNASVIQCLEGIKERAGYRYVPKGIVSRLAARRVHHRNRVCHRRRHRADGV